MTSAWNVAAAWANIAGNASALAASNAATNMPVSLLQQEDIGRRFRATATTTDIDFTYAATQSADIFDFLGTNLTAAATVRIKLSNVSLGGTDIWDSGTLSNLVNPASADPVRGADLVVLSSAVRSGWKYCRVTVTDASLSYLDLGFAFFSTRTQYSINRSYGAQLMWIDPSEQKKTKGGQTKIRKLPKFRRCQFAMDFLTATERWALVNVMDITNAMSSPILFVLDPSSLDLVRDSIFGLLTSMDPVTDIQAFGSDGLNMYSRTYQIDERL